MMLIHKFKIFTFLKHAAVIHDIFSSCCRYRQNTANNIHRHNSLMLITKAEESSRPLRSLTEQSRMGSQRTTGIALTHFTTNSMVSLFCKREFYVMLSHSTAIRTHERWHATGSFIYRMYDFIIRINLFRSDCGCVCVDCGEFELWCATIQIPKVGRAI